MLKIPLTEEEKQTLDDAAARSRGDRTAWQYGTATWAREVLLGIASRGDKQVLEEMLRQTLDATEHLRRIRASLREPTKCPSCGQDSYYIEILNCLSCGYSPLEHLKGDDKHG